MTDHRALGHIGDWAASRVIPGVYRVFVDSQHEDDPVTAKFERDDAITSALEQLDDDDVRQVWVTDPDGDVIFRSSVGTPEGKVIFSSHDD